jgi:hypothetical protein
VKCRAEGACEWNIVCADAHSPCLRPREVRPLLVTFGGRRVRSRQVGPVVRKQPTARGPCHLHAGVARGAEQTKRTKRLPGFARLLSFWGKIMAETFLGKADTRKRARPGGNVVRDAAIGETPPLCVLGEGGQDPLLERLRAVYGPALPARRPADALMAVGATGQPDERLNVLTGSPAAAGIGGIHEADGIEGSGRIGRNGGR